VLPTSAYIAAIGEIESEVHEVELTGDNLNVSQHQVGIGVAHFVQNVVEPFSGELVLTVSWWEYYYSWYIQEHP
jgi:hypothetical protein